MLIKLQLDNLNLSLTPVLTRHLVIKLSLFLILISVSNPILLLDSIACAQIPYAGGSPNSSTHH